MHFFNSMYIVLEVVSWKVLVPAAICSLMQLFRK